MKKILFITMIMVCALLFSCATNSGDSEDSAAPRVLDGGTGAASVSKSEISAVSLASNPLFAKWAAKYEPALNPSFFGIPLNPDNAAFADISADVKARKTKAENLASENRFLDAWYAYGADDNEYIIALKTLHAIDCFTDTVMHQMFVFSNINPDQDLFEYRASYSQGGEKVFWDPVDVIQNYVKNNCSGVMPHILEMALGCYYQCAAYEFGDDWFMSQEDAYELSVEYFKKSIVAGVYNDYSLYSSIDSFLSAGYLNDGLEIIHCLELTEPENSFFYTQEALAYMYKGEFQNAMPCAAKAVICSSSTREVAAGAQILADAFMYDSRDVESALTVLEVTKPYQKDDYWSYNVFKALDILLFANQDGSGAYDDQIIAELTGAFTYEPYDSDYLYDLIDFFYSYGCPELGIKWMASILPDWAKDNLASGRLNFELGQLYVQVGDWQKALNCFNDAEKQLKAAGAFDASTSNIPYYQNLCREQLVGAPRKNKA